jgi:uncharacterized protein
MQTPHYDPSLDERPLTDVELDDLDALLQPLPGAMNVEMLDGYVAALLLDPKPLPERPGDEWLPAVWGGTPGEGAADDGPAPFASGRQRKRAAVLVLRHVHAVACQWQRDAERWEPLFSVAEAGGQEWVDAEDWCIGFLEATSLNPEAWDARFDDPVLAPVLAPIALLGGDDEALDEATRQRLADPEERAALARGVVEAVLTLVQQQREAASRASTS